MGAGPTARSGLRPNPRGGCAPATCSKVKTSPQRPKHLAQCAGKLEAVAMRLPLSKSQIRKEARRRSFAPPPGPSFDYKMLSRELGHQESEGKVVNNLDLSLLHNVFTKRLFGLDASEWLRSCQIARQPATP